MLLLLGDVLAPLLAAMGFALLGLIIRTLSPVLGSNWRNFAVFLLAFALFLVGRPLQLLVG
ncbi:MAG: hypothetical protein ACOCXJ_04615 [Planctomycetota bacterium]